mmetsp:Transcript_23877/g.52807  ORF Transcript_23877/g.52807 Transcript_23877/m.52807 type:complete len:200 (+) Transcript_23877:280-879(+)|eukprot:CAMPEP_0201132468 /NCGR_PEP_ID=MMETSP0850-20130426/45867_1 /ASSEMBLY_ACC=CAM_ASM_000622 /TAXON_ID=183588 /ORGANISM="Pseudo-nitzschia fraudulenta, Strain WWA7" /LENGTH=199 /DNA_ID=CAMNT_0047402813 /DNA_START=267 /DNA_END=866 /DNA_ORIENTATION=+
MADKVYLYNCPFEEKDDAKAAGARWDPSEGRWYVFSDRSLEPFNRWHPNHRKYLVCGYDEKDDAKKAGAKWDRSASQWYFDARTGKESRFSRWLPSSKKSTKTKASKAKTTAASKRKPAADNDNGGDASSSPRKKTKTKALTKKERAVIPRVNADMTVAQLQTECRARDPSVKGLSGKKKGWLLDHLGVGTPWISSTEN